MVGSVKLRVLNGNATTPADEADVELTVDVTDVRNPTGLSDYTGELRLSAALRTTDRLNGLAGNGPATGTDTSLTATIGCASTPADASIGSSLLAGDDARLPDARNGRRGRALHMGAWADPSTGRRTRR